MIKAAVLTSGAPARAAAAMSRAAAVAVAASRLVIILTAAAAAAAAPDAALADYFDIAESIWPDPESAAAKCLRVQRKEGWRGPSHRFDAAFKTLGVEGAGHFKTLGVEGAGHHWLATLPLEACGAGSSRSVKRCGGLSSFSSCGDCCDAMNKGKGIKYVKRKDVDYAWRCFEHDKPNYPRVFEGHHHIVLVRDPRSAFESVLRRFWRFRTHGGEVDTLAREETVFAASLNRLEAKVKRLDCRRTLFLEFDVARRAPRAHAAALSAFLGRPGLAAIAAWFGEAGDERNASAVATAGEDVDCVSRIKPWLPKLRDYAAWLHGGHTPSDPGCDEDVAPITRLCGNGTADDRACAEAWLDRARRCAERLRDKHHLSTVPAARPLARCVDGASSR